MSICSFYVFAEKKAVTIEVYPTVFSFNGLNPPTSGAKMALKNNKVDLSSVIRNLERVKKSHYENMTILDCGHYIIQNDIARLCESSKKTELCITNANTELQAAINKIKEELSEKILYPEKYKPLGESNFMQAYC